MIDIVNRRQRSIILSYAIVIFLIVSVVGICFIYKREYLEVKLAQSNLASILVENFNINERLADGISVRYLQTKAGEKNQDEIKIPSIDRHPTHNIYGVNVYRDKLTPELKGTLQAQLPITKKIISIIKSVDDICYLHYFNDCYAKRTHYFFSYNENYIYFTHYVGFDSYVFNPSRATTFALFGNPPTYMARKFTSDPKKKGITSTDIYTDPITHTKTYSVVSYVYDLSSSQCPILGTMMFDYSEKDLQELLHKAAPSLNSGYTSAKLVTNDTGREIFLLGNKDHSDQLRLPISAKYSIVYSINPWLFPLLNRSSLIAMLAAFFCASLFRLAAVRYIASQNRENLTDHLTKTYNRKVLELLPNKNVSGKSILAIIDCNKFKFINDNYGHDKGDNALAYISRTITRNIRRHNDMVIRLGGDEFCIIFRGIDRHLATDCLKRINHQLAGFEEEIQLSVSYGIVEIAPDEPIGEAIKRADVILYQQKTQHRQPDSLQEDADTGG